MAASTMSLEMDESSKDLSDMIEYLVEQVANPANKSEFRELLWRLEWDTITEESHNQPHQDSLEQLADAVSISKTLEPTDNRNTVKRQWKVVDELVYSTLTIAIRKQMDYFAQEHLRWTLISCPTVNNRISIHLAMGIGAKLVVGIKFYDLTTESADQQLLAVESLLDVADFQVTATDITLYAPDEHYAINKDDPKLLEWLLAPVQDNSLGQLVYPELYVPEVRDLLHLAAQTNSSLIVKWFGEKLPYEQWFESVQRKDRNGGLPIHLAILAKGSAVLHQILKPLVGDDLETVLHTENYSCQTALQLVNNERQYQDVKGLIEYHRQLRVDDQLMEFFDDFEFSLFSYELKATREKVAHRRIEDRSSDDPATKRNINMDAAICLMQGNMSKAKELIDTAMEIVPEDINTWCNRGKYLLMVEDAHLHHTMAMKPAFKMLELLTDKSLDNRLRAQSDYAYFIAEANRGDKDRRQSKVIFNDCLAIVDQCDNSDLMRAHCCYLFIKTLVRGLKPHSRQSLSESEVTDDLHKSFDLLAELATLHHSPEYDSTMWVWLAEVQFLNLSEDLINTELEEFTQSTGLTETSPISCLEKASEIVTHNENTVNRKTRANIARNCLKLSHSTRDMNRKIYLLERAVNDSERWMNENYWTFECANTAADALWLLWNIDMYYEHTELVKDTNFYTSLGRSQLEFDLFGVQFCIRELYHPFLRGHPVTEHQLPRAKELLATLIEEDDGWAINGIKYSRIKYLLGDPHEEIVAAFTNTIENSLPGKAKARALQHYGFYQGIVGNRSEAESLLRKAMDEKKGFIPHMARNGLQLLRQGKPFYPPPRD